MRWESALNALLYAICANVPMVCRTGLWQNQVINTLHLYTV